MPLPTLTPVKAKELLDQGAVLVDIREPNEHARERIPGAHLLPLSRLDMVGLALQAGKPVIFHCKSGARTLSNKAHLAGKAGGASRAFIVEGGIEAWKRAGLPVAVRERQPLSLQRQVQIAAGGLALSGTLLGAFAAPEFFVVPGIIGAGLMMAGITGFCPMARILVQAPWNRSAHGQPKSAPAP